MTSKTIAIIGGGPAGLRAAEVLSKAGHSVTVYDHMATVGRKMLMAGRGGLNITHSEPLADYVKKYGTASPLLAKAFETFSPDGMKEWCAELGIETFVGSSGRIFPKEMKASPLLRAWLKRLEQQGVHYDLRHRWMGWEDESLVFETPQDKHVLVKPDATLLALGGASWPKLGSDAAWTDFLKQKNIPLSPFRAANCGFIVAWSDLFREKFAGQPLKPVMLSFKETSFRGEVMLTQTGIEGSGIYALSAALRDEIDHNGKAVLRLDLRPDISLTEMTQRMSKPRGSQTLSNHLRKRGGLSAPAASLLREAQNPLPENPEALAKLIKDCPVTLTAINPIEKAISSAGGIKLDALDENYMLRALPGVFAAGEMLDWEAPTGGYLLQGCFSTASAAANGLMSWLK